jgi:hypothetical protein
MVTSESPLRRIRSSSSSWVEIFVGQGGARGHPRALGRGRPGPGRARRPQPLQGLLVLGRHHLRRTVDARGLHERRGTGKLTGAGYSAQCKTLAAELGPYPFVLEEPEPLPDLRVRNHGECVNALRYLHTNFGG